MVKPVEKPMSQALIQRLGEANLVSSTEPDVYQKFAVIREATREAAQLAYKRANPYSEIPETADGITAFCIQNHCAERDGVMALAKIHHCTEDDLFGTLKALPKLANSQPTGPPSMTPKSIFRFLAMTHSHQYMTSSAIVHSLAAARDHQSPRLRAVPVTLKNDGKTYTRQEITYLISPQGKINGGIAHYRIDNGLEIQLPLKRIIEPAGWAQPTINNSYLSPGFSSNHRGLFYTDHIEKLSHDGVVFLCVDLRIAKILADIIHDSRRYAPEMFAATAWYGGDRLLKGVHFSSLWGRNVVLIPAISRESFSTIFHLSTLLKKLGARTVRILPKPVLCRQPKATGSDAQAILASADPWERFIVNEHIVPSDHESLILELFNKWAIDEAAYEKWAIEVGLLYDPNQERPKPNEPTAVLSPSEFSRRTSSSKASRTADTSAFVRKGHSGLMYGDTNSAKSMMGIGLAVALACGKEFCGFSAVTPQHVLLVDAETEEDDFGERIQRTQAAFNVDSQLLDKYMHLKHLPSMDSEFDLNLTNQDFLDNLELDIVTMGIEIVVLDNLIWLLPGFRGKGQSLWANFITWMTRMERTHNIAFLLIHHSNLADKAAGTRDIEAQCKNVIFVEGRDKLMAEADKTNDGPTANVFRDFFHRDGVLSRTMFKKCKVFPELEMKPFGVFLALDTENRTEGPPWQRIEIKAPFSDMPLNRHNKNSAADNEENNRAQYPELPEDERKVMELAYEKAQFIRDDVEELLDCKSTKAGMVIKSLKTKAYLDERGQGKAITYCLRRRSDEFTQS